MRKIRGYTRSDGTKVKGYSRKKSGGSSRKRKSYTPAQRRAFERSKKSSSGHKSWRARQKDAKRSGKSAGLWSNYHAKKHRQSLKRKRR